MFSRFAIVIFVSTFGLSQVSANDDNCNDQLARSSMLRYFRGGKDYVQKRTGMYIGDRENLRYLPGKRTEKLDSPLMPVLGSKNFGSHMEIIRRQLGAARFNEIMRSRNPDKELSKALQEEIEPDLILDPAELKSRIAHEFADNEPLSPLREAQVYQILLYLGRLADNPKAWLRSLATQDRLQQLPARIVQDPVERAAKKGVYVYKAIRANVFLNGEKTIQLSAGHSGSPDSVHRMQFEVLRMIVPDGRIRGYQSGYFMIKQYIPGETQYGSIQYINKGTEKQYFETETYDFRNGKH